MAVKLYVHAMSQPCRSVMLFLQCTNVPHENIIVNPQKGMISFYMFFPFGLFLGIVSKLINLLNARSEIWGRALIFFSRQYKFFNLIFKRILKNHQNRQYLRLE